MSTSYDIEASMERAKILSKYGIQQSLTSVCYPNPETMNNKQVYVIQNHTVMDRVPYYYMVFPNSDTLSEEKVKDSTPMHRSNSRTKIYLKKLKNKKKKLHKL